jgi:hypothetical protein
VGKSLTGGGEKEEVHCSVNETLPSSGIADDGREHPALESRTYNPRGPDHEEFVLEVLESLCIGPEFQTGYAECHERVSMHFFGTLPGEAIPSSIPKRT